MTFDKFKLTNKTALITGAAGLLGYEHSIALLESGANVVLTDINERSLLIIKNKLIQNYESNNIFSSLMDVTSHQSILLTSKKLIALGLRIDILVNNASIDPKVTNEMNELEFSRLENFSLDRWNNEISVGLTGAFLCSQIFGTLMASDCKGGVILNISSDLSVFSPDQRIYRKDGLSDNIQPVKPITYSVIKTGLIGLTRYLATYWADKGVRSNALSPGGVFNNQGDEFVKKLSDLIPLGRLAKHDEYRAAVQFLCSDASGYMNGQNIIMDGGRSAW